MYFWKLDEETIRCLINKDEIDQMGFDLEHLGQNDEAMNDFLNAVVENSLNYVNWNPENGVQNYVARPLPADQFLITISCTFPEDAINRDLKQIGKMTQALKKTITQERIDEIFQLDGEEKEKAFSALTRDLHNVCNGNIPADQEGEPVSGKATQNTQPVVKQVAEVKVPDQVVTFSSFNDLVTFTGLLTKKMFYQSDLYKMNEQYKLFVHLEESLTKEDVMAFTLAAEECGGNSMTSGYEESLLKEHGILLISQDAIKKLHSF